MKLGRNSFNRGVVQTLTLAPLWAALGRALKPAPVPKFEVGPSETPAEAMARMNRDGHMVLRSDVADVMRNPPKHWTEDQAREFDGLVARELIER